MNLKSFTKEVIQRRFRTAGFLIILLMLAGAFNASAQCNPSIDTMSVVVSSTQTINGGFDPIWVCPNDTLHSDGGFHNTYLEQGAVMTTGGGIDTIYVKNGASFFMYGGIHVIFYVTDSDLKSLGGIPTLILCDTLTFDYTHAPQGGCIPTSISAHTGIESESLVYPNPVSTLINFDLTGYSSTNYEVDIYNAVGKRILEGTISQSTNSINATNFDSGIYFYTIRDKKEMMATGKFVVE